MTSTSRTGQYPLSPSFRTSPTELVTSSSCPSLSCQRLMEVRSPSRVQTRLHCAPLRYPARVNRLVRSLLRPHELIAAALPARSLLSSSSDFLPPAGRPSSSSPARSYLPVILSSTSLSVCPPSLEHLLETEGCDVDLQTRMDASTPLHLAVKVTDHELRLYLVRSLLEG